MLLSIVLGVNGSLTNVLLNAGILDFLNVNLLIKSFEYDHYLLN